MAGFLRFLLVVILIVACIGLVGGVWMGDRIPKLAAEKFGPPGPGLTLPQRVMYSVRLLSNESSLLSPLDKVGKPRSFQIALGESVNSIATRLEDESFISNADTFRTYLIYAGLDTSVQAGAYQLSPSMNMVEIARKLQDAVPEEVDFRILPGWRVEEISALLPTSGLSVTQNEFLNLVENPPESILPEGVPAGTSLEGYLMPGRYVIRRTVSADALVRTFIERFNESVTPEMREGFTNQGLDLAEAVTLASIVQRESVLVEEQPMIASVFYNRLEDGMRLESDPTVQYALGYQLSRKTWWKNPLSSSDLQIISRYNTYINYGLPPGPISNPGLDALRAVAYPAQTGYFYFRAQCDGSGRHFFAVTYDEHLRNACP